MFVPGICVQQEGFPTLISLSEEMSVTHCTSSYAQFFRENAFIASQEVCSLFLPFFAYSSIPVLTMD